MASKEPEQDTLLDPALPRTYLRIRPSPDGLNGQTVEQHLQRLHGTVGPPTENARGLHSLFRSGDPPTAIEWLLVSTGEENEAIQYLVRLTNEAQDLDALEGVLRGLFPNTYEFERVEAHPDAVLPDAEIEESDLAPSAVEFQGRVERPKDWQTQLTPFEAFVGDDGNENARTPLAAIVEAMASNQEPMLYQVLLRPKAEWSAEREYYRTELTTKNERQSGVVDRLEGTERDQDSRSPPQPRVPRQAEQVRIAELDARDARHTFDVNARLVAFESSAPGARTDAEATVRGLQSALSDLSRTCYSIESVQRTGERAWWVYEDICDCTVRVQRHERWGKKYLRIGRQSRGIVADASEVGSFCLVSGAGLTAAGERALGTVPGEQTAIVRPPESILRAYRGQGFALGRPLTQDDTPDARPVAVPPSLQSLHMAWFGKTGAGKSTGLVNAMLENHAATDGADILIDPKGDGMPLDYLRAHYAAYGTLENVLYFDCAQVLPAMTVFDVRAELQAGISRATAVTDAVDHYMEMLTQIMGRERFERAVRSPDVIRYLVTALFDERHGGEAFSHRLLHMTAREMHEQESPPVVSDPDLQEMLYGVVANDARSFDRVMQGVMNRIEKVPADPRLARMFNHVGDLDGSEAHFDLREYLDEDVVIIIDTGGLREAAQRVLALVVLSNLWTALRRRARDSAGDDGDGEGVETQESSLPLVNVYIEEAASVATSDLLSDLLAQSRGFGCSLTLAMQFPTQLRGAGERRDSVYEEILNNVSTLVVGNVPDDARLARRLATDDMDATAVANRLRALRRGQWLVGLPAAFDQPEPRPFLVRSLAPPASHPASSVPLAAARAQGFETAFEKVRGRSSGRVGLEFDPGHVAQVPEETLERVDTLLAITTRMPPTVEYLPAMHALRCHCGDRYDPDIAGMKRAIACCSSLDEVDRDDIPVCDLNLKLTEKERLHSEWTDRQLLFVQAVFDAQQMRFDPLEYDLLYDSMVRLREYVGLENEAVEELVEAGVLRHDTDHPHRIYSVAPEHRSVIGEGLTEGVDFGPGVGDFGESSLHVMGVEVGRRYLEATYVDDPESPVTRVETYHAVREEDWLDVVGLDAEGTIRVVVEVKRDNNDAGIDIPETYDKIAACEPDEAIWVVESHDAGHRILDILRDPVEGPPRVEKSYSKATPPKDFRIGTPGLTLMFPVKYLRDLST